MRGQVQTMIIALVQISLDGSKRSHGEVTQQSIASTEIFRDVEGLQRKCYLNSEDGGGGIYEFETRADAEAWFNEDWADWMEGRFAPARSPASRSGITVTALSPELAAQPDRRGKYLSAGSASASTIRRSSGEKVASNFAGCGAISVDGFRFQTSVPREMPAVS